MFGCAGYTANLAIRIVQEFGIARPIASRLVDAFGGRAYVCDEIMTSYSPNSDAVYVCLKDVLTNNGKEDPIKAVNNLIAPGFYFSEAEVRYSIRHEWAVKAEDILARRTRLAFLNKEAAMAAIPRVAEIMASELNWSEAKKMEEIKSCTAVLDFSFAGPVPRNVSSVN